MHEVLVNRLGGLSLPRKSVVRLIDCPNMTLDVYRGRKTTIQQPSQTPAKIIYSRTSMAHDLHLIPHSTFIPPFLSNKLCKLRVGFVDSIFRGELGHLHTLRRVWHYLTTV